MSRSKERERFFAKQGAQLKEMAVTLFPRSREDKKAVLAVMYGVGPAKQPLTATKLTADTCCALGVHSQWCGCRLDGTVRVVPENRP